MLKKLLCLLLVLTLLLAGCKAETPAEEMAPSNEEYTVTVHTMGGMAMTDIQVYIYEGDDLAAFGQTDENGLFTATLPENAGYTVTLESVPKGYSKEASYTFTGTAADIRLESRLIEDDLSGATLGVGDVMYDFSVVAADGTEVTLSKMLEEKDMVLINFFYTTCGPCVNEFPFMQQAYEEYEDRIGIIALDPLDDTNTVALFQSSMGLTFPMAACNPAWSQTFNVPGYPTSIVVDRYGLICAMEVGGITSLRPFTTLFETFSSEDYAQKLYGSINELLTNVKPTFDPESDETLQQVLDTDMYEISYRHEEGESAEYTWPFIATEKNGVRCLKASNQNIDSSYAILYADVYLEAGQAVSFDYLASSEKSCDVLYVIVDGQDVLAISGWNEQEIWETCYPWVAEESRVHEVALCYLKDGDTNEADDTVYISNLCIGDSAAITIATYIPRQAAVSKDGFQYTYADIVLSEEDGYYHVGTADGPLLLINLMDYTQFSEERTLWDIVYGSSVTVDGKSLYDTMVHYFSYASNSSNSGVTAVTQELLEYMTIVDTHHGFDEADPNEWLKACFYYAPYGTEVQLSDPCAGLSTHSALEAKLGKNVESNFFYYDRPIMPRGLLARFTPKKSGVYKITSHADSANGVDAWIFTGDNHNGDHYTYAADQRMQPDVLNCYMYYYMEAGQDYYIDIAFWDIYEVGTIPYDIEYVAKSYDLFRLASPGFFTYDTNATGEHMYDIIAGGIDVVLGEDGIYYEDLGDGQKGSKLYCDFTGISGIFSDAIATVQAYDEDGKPLYDDNGDPVMRKGLIDKGGFDFSKTENDQYVLTILEKYNGDTQKAEEYLRTFWGEDFEANAEAYQLEDVFAGKYHGRGEDYTDEISAYLKKMIKIGPKERRGCVVVTEELAQLLQLLMDKFTFGGVENSWTKLCYYYDYLGPEK